MQEKLYAEIRVMMGEQGASDLTWGYDIISKIPFALAYVSRRRMLEACELIDLQGLPRNLTSAVRWKLVRLCHWNHTHIAQACGGQHS